MFVLHVCCNDAKQKTMQIQKKNQFKEKIIIRVRPWEVNKEIIIIFIKSKTR